MMCRSLANIHGSGRLHLIEFSTKGPCILMVCLQIPTAATKSVRLALQPVSISSQPHSAISCLNLHMRQHIVFIFLLRKSRSPPLFFAPKNYTHRLDRTKLLNDTSSTTFKAAKNPKWRNLTSPTLSVALLIIPMLLTTRGITTPWEMRGRKFWPGYLHLNP